LEALPWLDAVYRVARAWTRNDTDAKDLVQETYLRAYRSWHTFERGSDARSWLFTICRNAFFRTRERARLVALAEHDLESAAQTIAEADGAVGQDERLLARVDLVAALSHALDCLQEPFRSVVMLVLVQDQSYATASVVLGVPVGTVRSRLSRGRRLLQGMLASYVRDGRFASAGSVNDNRAPRGELPAAHRRPPCDSTMERLIDSPIPIP
jgi:RNA polymerase sigma-70 factor (ECF subfamily)